jgi:hypothetical protein
VTTGSLQELLLTALSTILDLLRRYERLYGDPWQTVEAAALLAEIRAAFNGILAPFSSQNVPAMAELVRCLTNLQSELARVEAACDRDRLHDVILTLEIPAAQLNDRVLTMTAQTDEGLDRIKLIGRLVQKFNYQRYLEIGCRDDACFARVAAGYRVGVDPISGGTLRMTSDEYFASAQDRFDLIFVDGLHEAQQVFRDVTNALKLLMPGGTIVMHDCAPAFEICQIVPMRSHVWNGDVWKGFVHLREDEQLDAVTVNCDHGCGVVRRRPNSAPIRLPKPYLELNWYDLQDHRAEWLRVRPWAEVEKWL